MSSLPEMTRGLLTRVNTHINRFIHKECDFCFRYGHTFHECTDPELDIMLHNLYVERERIKTDMSLSEQHIEIHLYNYIFIKANVNEYGRRKWKSFAIKMTGYVDNSNPDSDTVNWIYHIVKYILQNEPEMTNNDESNDFIPFNENDAINYLTNFNDIVNNNQREEINNQHDNQLDSETNTNLVNEQLGFLLLSVLQYERMQELFDEKKPINYNHKMTLILPHETYDNMYLNNVECNICCESKEMTEFVRFDCKHHFCGNCTENMLIINDSDNIKCAFCRKEVTKLETFNMDTFHKIEKYIDSEYILHCK